MLGKKQLKWVADRNADCIAAVGDPRATESYKRILSILESTILKCIMFKQFSSNSNPQVTSGLRVSRCPSSA